MTGDGWFRLRADTDVGARVAAIAEPGFVLIAGTILARIALSRLRTGDTDLYLYGLDRPDFVSAAVVQFVSLTVRYGTILGLAAVLGLWRGRSTAASYGVTLGQWSLSKLIGIGILLGLVASLPGQILRLVSQYVNLGPGTPFWALESRVPWDAAFWLYTAVGSYLVVPVFEELFARGYLLGRVRESFSPGGSLLAMAVFFSFAHGQYRHPDALALGMLTSLLVWSAICGYAVYRTSSLVPVIVAHGLDNVPMTLGARWAVLAAAFLALVLWRKAITSWTLGIIDTLRAVDDWPTSALAIAGIAFIIISLGAVPWAAYAWLVVLGSVSFYGLRRRSAWTHVDELLPDSSES